jgi:hypothetical protein
MTTEAQEPSELSRPIPSDRDLARLLTFSRQRWLVRQPHLVMFEALSLVVAAAGAGLVESSPV